VKDLIESSPYFSLLFDDGTYRVYRFNYTMRNVSYTGATSIYDCIFSNGRFSSDFNKEKQLVSLLQGLEWNRTVIVVGTNDDDMAIAKAISRRTGALIVHDSVTIEDQNTLLIGGPAVNSHVAAFHDHELEAIYHDADWGSCLFTTDNAIIIAGLSSAGTHDAADHLINALQGFD